MKFKQNTGLIIVTLIASVLRLVNLGYSDYQGDEIKALYLPSANQSFLNFILDQRKGPIQFVITYLLKFAIPNYDNYFLMRLPFALAGILSVVVFYLFIKHFINKQIAFYSSFFLATCGFFIAFSRIVQYQSFVILFAMLALYSFALSIYSKKYKLLGIYIGFLFWTFSLLSHYDGVFIFPMVLYFFILHLKSGNKKNLLKHFSIAGMAFVFVLGLFYIPFVFTLSNKTLSYWNSRLTPLSGGKISSSRYLFQVYQPIYVIHIYTLLFLLGLIYFISTKIKYLKSLFKLSNTDNLSTIFLLFWLFMPLVFFEITVHIPGTHIYTYLIPAVVVMSFGIEMIEKIVLTIFNKLRYSKIINYLGIFTVFIFIFLQSYAVFVDHITEYPWEEEKFLIWQFNKPTPIFHLSMFGFPYYRNWDGISKYITLNNQDNLSYSTNERKSITRYYLPNKSGKSGLHYYIYINNPQSFTNEILNSSADAWIKNNDPIYNFIKNGKILAKIYLIPEANE